MLTIIPARGELAAGNGDRFRKEKPAEPVRQDSRIKPAGSPVGKSHSGVSEHRAAGGELGNLAVHLVDD